MYIHFVTIGLGLMLGVAILPGTPTSSQSHTYLKTPAKRIQVPAKPLFIPLAQTSLTSISTPAPTPEPAPAVVAPAPTSMEGIVRAAAVKHGVSPDYLVQVGRCESGLNPNSVNYGYYAGGGNPSGMFQFIPSTWTRMSNQAGYSGASVFNASANAHVAAWGFANGRASEWACS